MKPYDYSQRKGVLEVSWEDFAKLAGQLAEKLEPYHVQGIIGIARAGLFPATAVALALRLELYPARLTRRLNDQVIYSTPVWKTPVSTEVAGKVVAVVDEMADTGQTLNMVADAARLLGASQVITSSLVAHSWADPMPELCALVSDAFIVFPWGRHVLVDGKWQPHPEIQAALALQDRADLEP